MPRRTAATIAGVVAATLLIAGIAWASGADDSPTSTTTLSTSTSIGDRSTSTGLDGQTSTTVDDDTSSSSADSSTSTTVDDDTSSTIDDDDDTGRGGHDDDEDDNDDNSGKGGDDDDDAVAVDDGPHTYDVAGVGQVTVNVASGQLQLADVKANAGWTVEVDEAGVDRIKVKFRNGENEAEFEAELEHGGIKIEVEAGH